LKKVCYKFSLCENCQRQSSNGIHGLSIRAKMIDGGRSLLRENLANTDLSPCTTPPMSLRWTSYVVSKPPKGGSKRQNGRFSCKIALHL